LKALVRHCGDGLTIGSQVGFKHPETFEIGGSVFIGAGAYHTRNPAHVPIVKTDLEIRPMRVRAWIDIGTNAVLLPAVSIGKGAIVGAGTGVTKDVPPFAIVARVPARLLWWREGRTNSRAQPLPPRRASTNR
jgi:acetyltransferase-like isoleucine patch superfamily enzyme